jgi:hypothetical protein
MKSKKRNNLIKKRLKMKLLFLCATLLFLSWTCLGQDLTEVGKLKRGGVWLADLTYGLDGTDTVYIITYRDQEYQRIDHKQTFAFKVPIDSVYNALRSGQSFHPDVSISEKSMLGAKYILVHVANKGFFNITIRELDRLFGRR